VGDMSKESRSPLLPDRYPTPDFFVCDNFVEITPSVAGLATIHDRDVLIYCISQLIAGLNEGRDVSQTVRFKAYDLLQATNRMTNGQGYDALKSAFERLRGTTITTDIITGGEEQLDVFGLIDRARIVRQTRDGRMQEVEIMLSDWVFNAIKAKEVLTLHRDYFRLRKPLERRIYELARKHCGTKNEWRISLNLLQKKCGSSSTSREFKRLISNIVAQDREHCHIPDYAVTLEERGDAAQIALPFLKPETYEAAREIALGWDAYFLESEWRTWMRDKSAPTQPDKAFLGFCRKWFDKRGKP